MGWGEDLGGVEWVESYVVTSGGVTVTNEVCSVHVIIYDPPSRCRLLSAMDAEYLLQIKCKKHRTQAILCINVSHVHGFGAAMTSSLVSCAIFSIEFIGIFVIDECHRLMMICRAI